MKRSVRLFCWAFVISGVGSLPVGTLNASVTDLVVHAGIAPAVWFGVGAILAEVTTVGVALAVLPHLKLTGRLRRILYILGCLVIFCLAGLSFEAAWHTSGQTPVAHPGTYLPFLSGYILSLLNPLHLPFWMGWTMVLRSKNILGETRWEYTILSGGIGMGTAMAFLLYGVMGRLLVGWLREYAGLLNGLIGITLVLTGLLLLRRIWKGDIVKASGTAGIDGPPGVW